MDSIKAFKKQLKESGQPGLALDIDETLSWTVGYWFEKMLSRFGNPENLSVMEMIQKYRYSQHVPYWQTEETHIWINEMRNSNALQEQLQLIEKAHHIVEKIHTIIPVRAYITTRPESVVSGTKKWLRTHNFPTAEVLLRPPHVPHLDGNLWKAKVLEQLYPEIIGIIDDNPGLVDALSNEYKGTVFLYDNIDHPRRDIHVIPCRTWDDIYMNIKKIYQS